MQNTFLKALLLLISVQIIMPFACICPDEEIIITGQGKIYAYQHIEANSSKDTITSAFTIENTPDQMYVAHAVNNLWYASLYATSCEPPVQNPITRETISLSVDKSMMVDGQEISSGVNLISVDGVEAYTNGAYVIIVFSETYIEQSIITEGLHNFTLSFSTSDGLILSNEIELYLDW